MNNKFKRAISSILAFVMVISVLTVMNVSTAFAADDYFYAALDASSIDLAGAEKITLSSKETISDFFAITADSESTVEVESNTKTVPLADGTSISVSNRIKTGGTGTNEHRSIEIKPTYNGKVYAYAMSSSSGTARTINLLDSSGTTVDYKESYVSGSTMTEITFDVSKGNTYYLASASGGINFYYVGLLSEEAETSYTTYSDAGTYYYYAADDDLSANETDGANSSIYTISDTVSSTGSFDDDGTSYDFTINGKTYTLSKKAKNGNHEISVAVPSDIDSATLYVVANSSGSGSRALDLKDNDSYSESRAVAGTAPSLVSYDDLVAGTTYKLSCSSDTPNWGFSLFVLVTQNESAKVDTVTHTVTLTDGSMYLVAGLSGDAEAVSAADSCVLYLGDDEVSGTGSIDTVYNGVQIDGVTYYAADFGYSYVYGFAIDDASTLTEAQVASLANYGLTLVTEDAE